MVDEVFVITNEIRARQNNATNSATHQFDASVQLLRGIMDEQAALRSEVQSGLQVANHAKGGTSFIRPTESINPNSIVGFKAHLPKPRHHPCASSCRCNCHERHAFRSPSLFNRILGCLFLSYSGHPLGDVQKCSSTTCRAQSNVEARVQYCFPFWFLCKMVELHFRMSSFEEPCISLIVRGVFSYNSDFYTLILLDNEKGLQRLLDSGGARPNDVGLNDGSNGLYVSRVDQINI